MIEEAITTVERPEPTQEQLEADAWTAAKAQVEIERAILKRFDKNQLRLRRWTGERA